MGLYFEWDRSTVSVESGRKWVSRNSWVLESHCDRRQPWFFISSSFLPSFLFSMARWGVSPSWWWIVDGVGWNDRIVPALSWFALFLDFFLQVVVLSGHVTPSQSSLPGLTWRRTHLIVSQFGETEEPDFSFNPTWLLKDGEGLISQKILKYF